MKTEKEQNKKKFLKKLTSNDQHKISGASAPGDRPKRPGGLKWPPRGN